MVKYLYQVVRKSNQMKSVDERDLEIIFLLMKNARMTKVEIAEKLGITETAVRKRLTKLERKGVILGYRPVINYKVAGLASSLTGVDVEPERLWEVIDEIKKIKEIYSVYLTTGDHVLMLEIVAKSVKELSKIHMEISKIDGVKNVCPSIILDVLSC